MVFTKYLWWWLGDGWLLLHSYTHIIPFRSRKDLWSVPRNGMMIPHCRGSSPVFKIRKTRRGSVIWGGTTTLCTCAEPWPVQSLVGQGLAEIWCCQKRGDTMKDVRLGKYWDIMGYLGISWDIMDLLKYHAIKAHQINLGFSQPDNRVRHPSLLSLVLWHSSSFEIATVTRESFLGDTLW